jgi:hypothetical protein
MTEISYGHKAPRHYTYWEPDELDAILSATGLAIVFQATYRLKNVTWLVRMARKP